MRISYFIQHGVWPQVALRRECETKGCLHHLELRPDLPDRRRPRVDAHRPGEPITCTTCRKQKPETAYYSRKGGSYLQPCRNCYQARAKKRDVKAAELMAKKHVMKGPCTCGCQFGGHRSDGKGPCSNCGPLKCPSYFERGL